MQRGAPLPKAIQNAPELEPQCEIYYDGFKALISSRYYEGGGIPYPIIADYADRKGLGPENADDFIAVILRVDAWFVSKMREQSKSKNRRGKK